MVKIKNAPQGNYKNGIWMPNDPDPKGLTDLEKYQEACKLTADINKLQADFVKAREKYRKIAQEVGRLVSRREVYLR